MIMMNATRHGTADLAPRPHRDGCSVFDTGASRALSFCAHDRDPQGSRTGVVAAARAILQGDQRIRVERAAAIGADHHFIGLARGR